MLDPSIFNGPISLPNVIDPPQMPAGGNAPAGGGNGPAGRPNPRFPQPDPRRPDLSIDTDRIPFPPVINFPQGGGNAPPNGDNAPPNGDDIPPEVGDVPPGDGGNVPPDGDVPPPVGQNWPWPIFWPLFPGGYCPQPSYPTYPAQVIVESAPQTAGVADLLLEDVQYVEPATLLVGPAYRVKFRNQGLEPVGTFRVALVAGLDGRLNEDSPRTMVQVAGLAGGQAGEATIRLPRTAMRLTNAPNAQPKVFTDLFVAVDVDGAVSELDETNNVAVLERTALEAATQ